jgi:serine/threonine protein kinase
LARACCNGCQPDNGCQSDLGTMQVPREARLFLTERYPRVDEGKGGRVGEGSFGAVYMAIDRVTQELVAVKRQPPGNPACADEVAAYELLRAFPHPNLLRMIDRFLEAGSMYLVLEFTATNLWKIWDSPTGRRGLESADRVHGYLRGVVLGVGHLHGLRVGHGDLSLSNILVDHEHCAKVADYGTAHCAHRHLSQSPTATGYVRAPEVWAGSPDCHMAGDSWAVGVVALALLTGECPWLTAIPPDASSSSAAGVMFREFVLLLGPVTEMNWR